MKTRKIPMRKCTGCQQVKEKRQLLRVVREPEGQVSIDRTGRKSGRGAYLCEDITCLEKAIKTRALERSLETEISPEVYENLIKELTEKDGSQDA